jgi:hypothetical protein
LKVVAVWLVGIEGDLLVFAYQRELVRRYQEQIASDSP